MNGRPEFILLNVNVTQEDIDSGKKRDCWHCPIAIAVNRAASEGKIPEALCSAGKLEIDLYCDYGTYTCVTPEVCEYFMCLFDEDYKYGLLGFFGRKDRLDGLIPFSFSLNFHLAHDQRLIVRNEEGWICPVLLTPVLFSYDTKQPPPADSI